MKKIFIALLLIVLTLPVFGQNQDEYKFSLVPRRVNVLSALPVNAAGYLYNNGSGGLSWGAIDTTSLVARDGTRELTADWNVGAFDLTCVDMNATNFKLSGTGTLASTLGNVSLNTALTAASGNEAAFTLNYTTNKAAGNDTGLVVNQTDTASPGTSYLMDLQVGTASKFNVDSGGSVLSNSLTAYGMVGSTYNYWGFANTEVLQAVAARNMKFSTALTNNYVHVYEFNSGSGAEMQNADNSKAYFYIEPKINQSGTAGYQALKINVTETGLGDGSTGANMLATLQISNVEKFGVDNKGAVNSTMINNADSDTDEVDSVTWAGGYGMVIAASTTDGTSAIWKLEGTAFTAISVDADWTAVKDNASSYNVYIEGGAIKLQNKVGDNKAVKLGFFGI